MLHDVGRLERKQLQQLLLQPALLIEDQLIWKSRFIDIGDWPTTLPSNDIPVE